MNRDQFIRRWKSVFPERPVPRVGSEDTLDYFELLMMGFHHAADAVRRETSRQMAPTGLQKHRYRPAL